MRFISGKTALFLSTLVILGMAPSAEAVTTLNLCNRNTDRGIFGAIMHQVVGAGWQSTGWYSAAAGQCTSVALGTYTEMFTSTLRTNTSRQAGETGRLLSASTRPRRSASTTRTPPLHRSHIDEGQRGRDLGRRWQQHLERNSEPNSREPLQPEHLDCNRRRDCHGDKRLLAIQGLVSAQRRRVSVDTAGEIHRNPFVLRRVQSRHLRVGSGPFQFCVNKTQPFTLSSADQPAQCTGTAVKMVNANQIKVTTGSTTVNFSAVTLKTTLQLCNQTTLPLNSIYAIPGSVAGQWQSTVGLP